MKPTFKIEQIAIIPKNIEKAKQLLIDLGAAEWVNDTVTAKGFVLGNEAVNVANLSFNYSMFGGKEFEILNYVEGDNWVKDQLRVSHLGMHCTADELLYWRDFFAQRDISVAQEVFTQNHTNPFLIDNGRKYNYVIFDTFDILGVDLKFIVRIEKE